MMRCRARGFRVPRSSSSGVRVLGGGSAVVDRAGADDE